MNSNHIKENYTFEKLSKEYNLNEFDCGDDDLNDFLKNDATIQQNNYLNITKLIIYNNKVIGFFSLLTDTIELKNLVPNQKNLYKKEIPYRKIPSLKIGRLALSKEYINKGIGSHVFINIILNIIKISQEYAGLRFITVDGYVKSYNFYLKHNFTHLKRHEKDIKNIEQLKIKNPTKTINMYQDIKRLNKKNIY